MATSRDYMGTHHHSSSADGDDLDAAERAKMEPEARIAEEADDRSAVVAFPARTRKTAASPYQRKSWTMDQFDKMTFPPRKKLIAPWLPSPGLAMIAGWRGVGKTFTAAGIALSVASGRPFLGWEVPEALPVLYVDGEMDPVEMRDDRLHKMRGALRAEERERVRANLHFLSHAAFPDTGIPDLSDTENAAGRKLIEDEAREAGAALIILDNLSSLCDSGVENEAESWTLAQQWLMKLRRDGYTVLILHHGTKPDAAGRSKQRGSSKREDVLNTSVMVHRLKGMGSDQFEFEFTKNRGFRPDDPFWVRIGDDGWIERAQGTERDAIIIGLAAQGLSQRKIGERVGCSAATVNTVLKRGSA